MGFVNPNKTWFFIFATSFIQLSAIKYAIDLVVTLQIFVQENLKIKNF